MLCLEYTTKILRFVKKFELLVCGMLRVILNVVVVAEEL